LRSCITSGGGEVKKRRFCDGDGKKKAWVLDQNKKKLAFVVHDDE